MSGWRSFNFTMRSAGDGSSSPIDLPGHLPGQTLGRWNRRGEYGCLYTSLTRAGAIAEYHKELAKVSGISAEEDHPRDLVSIHVVAKRVLDLTKPAVRKRMGVSLETITGDRVPDIDACRAIADLARLQGYRGILSPSAAADGMKNLNLYIDGRA